MGELKVAYFDCFSGISGDMALGALVDAGASFDLLTEELRKLDVSGYDIEANRTVKNGISSTDVTITLRTGPEPARRLAQITNLIESSRLSDKVKARSIAIFRRLAEAEAKIHGKSIDEVHFHEVGAVDAIVDIVGVCICLDLLGIERVYASPIPTFHGSVRIAHGTLPLPAPATIELLKGVPWRELGVEGEIVTPTGAAILAELAESYGPMPAMSIETVGFGAGKKDFGIPNVLRVVVGDLIRSDQKESSQFPFFSGACQEVVQGERDEVVVIETNIDDLSPQVYDVLMDRLFASGALDVFLAPIQMKKNRPAVLVSVMCAPEDTARMCQIIFEETSTIGIRIDHRSRICLAREVVTVDTRFGQIRVKVARIGGDVVNVQPEYEDCKAAAAQYSVPVKLVRDTAIAAFLTPKTD